MTEYHFPGVVERHKLNEKEATFVVAVAIGVPMPRAQSIAGYRKGAGVVKRPRIHAALTDMRSSIDAALGV
jgi:hypothetical protein